MPKNKANLFGQFNTSDELAEFVTNKINQIKEIKGDILEPSFGKGSFLEQLKKYDCNVTGIEIDNEIFNEYENTNNYELFNEDFLFYDSNKVYDFIIGNPPYIELCYSFYKETDKNIIKNQNSHLSNGRLNLVHAFFKKSFELIKMDGIIAYLLPSSILTSPVYKKIRSIIYNHFNVELLIEDVNFKNVAIKVSLLVIRKVKGLEKNNKYFYLNNDNYYIMEKYKNFSGMKTLKDYNFKVKIGNIVWNQVKELLTNDEKENILIYSNNIGKDKITLKNTENLEKKQYIKNTEVKVSNCIVMPRTISKQMKYALIQNNSNMIFENHVLVITNDDNNKLINFYINLKSGVYDELLFSFFNSSNLTTQEVLSLPLQVDIKTHERG